MKIDLRIGHGAWGMGHGAIRSISKHLPVSTSPRGCGFVGFPGRESIPHCIPTDSDRRLCIFPAAASLRLWVLAIALLYIICCLGLSGCRASSPQGTVVQIQRVLSGQTVEWTDTSQQPPTIKKVRLIGIESPDWQQQPWSGEAKVGLEKILNLDSASAERSVILEFDLEVEDNYARSLAYLWKDGILVNEQLVKQGYVLAASRSPNTKYERRLAYAQDYARTMGLGIWRSDRPMRQTPAEFQRQKQ